MSTLPHRATEKHVLHDGDLPSSLLDGFRHASRIAWDIETSGLDWRADRIALCQLYVEDQPVAMVRIRDETPRNLARLLADPGPRKIFHHAMFDVRFMAHQWSATPSNIACTKVASKLLFPGEARRQKLQQLVSEQLGIDLDKSEQTSNWLAPTYTESQLAYAVRDVIYLGDLLDVLLEKLERRGLRELALRCFDHIPTRVALELRDLGDVY
ncbi:MAG TPA: ribonuclease D, partial [Thermoanaerobaculia bacterium]|nr:ribonuclease D [Thermoanaerobaculia bacterium]